MSGELFLRNIKLLYVLSHNLEHVGKQTKPAEENARLNGTEEYKHVLWRSDNPAVIHPNVGVYFFETCFAKHVFDWFSAYTSQRLRTQGEFKIDLYFFFEKMYFPYANKMNRCKRA